MKRELTEKQNKIFMYIKDQIVGSGYPPTVREIGENFNITVKGAYDHLKAIEKKGYIKCNQNKSRAIELIAQREELEPHNSINIPLLGRIAAGTPIMAHENVEEYLSFPQSMFSTGEFFALNIKGDSMIDEGIYDGDIAIIKKQNSANNGEIIAALIEDEATLKILKQEKGKVSLLPANKAYSPIIPETLDILGKLAGVFRRY